jgi:uncharacterized membrane protein
MGSVLSEIAGAFNYAYSGWIAWNLFLAFIPLVLSFWLFRAKSIKRSWLWWIGFAGFLSFLPNAPYLLTDIIHLIRAIRWGHSVWMIVLVILPLHSLAILTGFEAYVVALMNLEYYLKRQRASEIAHSIILVIHALCAIGIYLGRFRRFNSWDLVTDPGNVVLSTFNDLTSKRPLAVILITFVINVVLYWLMKQITLGVMLRIRQVRLGRN